VVYARTVGDRILELGARGVERGTLLLYDRPTGSTWSQIQGRAVTGPLAGTRLEELPSVVTTWGQWRALHPKTSVYLDPGHPYKRWYTTGTFSRMNVPVPGSPRAEDWVVAVRGPRTTRVWLVRRLAATRVAEDVVDGVPVVVLLLKDLSTVRVLRRDVGGRTLGFAVDGDRLRDKETRTLWDPFTGRGLSGPLAGRVLEPVPFSTALWYAWSAHHPQSQVAP
jgi:hypothetical protein